MGSRINPWCNDNHYDYQGDIISCYYDNSVPTSNVTYTPHYAWGTMMLLPFLLNYLICWYVWATTDKRKAVTWVAALLSFYPQYVALKIIYQIWWVNPTRGLRKKRQLERDLIQFEVFYEAVTSTLVMTYLAVRAGDGLPGSEIIVDWNNPASLNSLLFFVAFSTSIITSSLGLSKNLKVGPCRILPEQKRYLGGFLSPKFILIFVACGFTLVGKGIALANVVVGRGRAGRGPCGADLSGGVAIALSTFFLPGVLVSMFACAHCEILKTFLVHPSVFLLPVFTHFTFLSKRNFCCEGENGGESFISFSPMTTAVNAGVCIAGALAYLFTLPLVATHPDWFCSTELFLKLGLPCTIIGLILTLVATFSNQCNCCRTCCCSCETFCCCFCCNSCCCEPFQFGALIISSPHVPYILGPDGQLVMEEKTHNGEDKEEAAEGLDLKLGEMEETKGAIDLMPSLPNISQAKKEVELETS